MPLVELSVNCPTPPRVTNALPLLISSPTLSVPDESVAGWKAGPLLRKRAASAARGGGGPVGGGRAPVDTQHAGPGVRGRHGGPRRKAAQRAIRSKCRKNRQPPATVVAAAEPL